MGSPTQRACISVAFPITMSWWLSFMSVRLVRADSLTTIDDSDPAIKAVNGTWTHFKGGQYYNGTETLTRDPGATSMYVFNGTGISVFGTQCDPAGGNTTVSTYMIDGGSKSTYTVPPGVICNQNFVNFFSSPPLENGQHTLLITNLNNGAWYFLDYLQVTSPALLSSTNVTSSSPSLSPPSAGVSIPAQTDASAVSGSSSISSGAIAGIAVGGVGLLALFLAAILVWRRRRQSSKKRMEAILIEPDEIPADLTPYHVPPPRSKSYTTGTANRPSIVTNEKGVGGDRALTTQWSPSQLSEESQGESSSRTDEPVSASSQMRENRLSITTTLPPAYGE
ncbi:hypothetical protein K439DRAFT_702488 [Ramaria rubella]|nr:hypothetical protein K439DRAFT_702488 [Ramaria rubella]